MVMDFWLAGMETSTTTLKWFFVLIMKYMDVQKKLQDEIDYVVGRDRQVKLSDKINMPYMSAFITEGQRYINMLPFIPSHKCTKDTIIGGHLIKAGTMTQPFFWGANYDEKYFKDPLTFRPERFLEDDGKTYKVRYDHMAFGKGKRICAGKSLAEAELFLFFTSFLQKYKFTHPNGPIDLTSDFGGVLLPNPYTCKLEKRLFYFKIMNRIFGTGKPKAPPPNLSEAVGNINSRGESIEKKISKLDGELVKLKDQMKKMREGPAKNSVKQKALRILKQKKMYESQKDQLDTQIFNMEQTNFALEGMKDAQNTVAAMKHGVQAMKKEFKKLDINKIDDLHDEMEDMLDMHNEIQDAMSRQYDTPDIDESELEAELEALGDELAFDEDSSYLDEALNTPKVPSAVPSAERKTEDGIAVDEFGLPKISA
uniref:Cytochrome P450 n=1 Tax=Parastrongyloides trichosuri TaxID=131310 RepID=A0A0N4ZM39_PARTI